MARRNAVLHYLAIAAAAEVEWTIDDFERVRKRVPVLCELKPSGRFVATDFHAAGGVPQVLRMLLDHGLLHGECMTITGQNDGRGAGRGSRGAARGSGSDPAVVEADVSAGPPRDPERQPGAGRLRGQDHRPQEDPSITGPARVFDSEPACLEAIMAKKIKAGRRDRHSLRRARRAGPGMQEMLAPTSALDRAGARRDRSGLITDGRFSGGTWGMVVGHVAPEAYVGGTIALVQEGDSITIDARKLLVQLNVDDCGTRAPARRAGSRRRRATRAACWPST